MSIFGKDYKGRKNIPIFTFLTGYFPRTLVELVKVAVAGNVQHNPEVAPTDIYWARDKSTDQLNTAMRHQFDHAVSGPMDEEPPEVQKIIGGNTRHLAKAIWRLCAQLELDLEAEEEQAKADAAITVTPQPRVNILGCQIDQNVFARVAPPELQKRAPQSEVQAEIISPKMQAAALASGWPSCDP